MIKPVRDSLISTILLLAGLAALGWGVLRLSGFGENDTAGGIATAIGGLTTLFAALLVLNFRWAFRIARRIQRGEGVIARWTVPATMIDTYLASQKPQPWHLRSRWTPKPGKPAEVLFSPDAVLAGDTLHMLSAKGLQTYTAVDLIDGNPAMIQFTTREMTVVGDRLTSYQGLLQLPVARGADEPARKVMAHFRDALRSAVQTNPSFWRSRRRIGLVTVLVSAVMAGTGWYLADQSGWRSDDTKGMTAMVLMITGAIFGLAGLILAAIATAKSRR